MSLGDDLIKRYEALKTERAPFDTLHQDIANYVMPRKADIASTRGPADNSKEQLLFNTTAIRANQTLANGQLSWMTPHESRWFSYDAPEQLSSVDRVVSWFRSCSDIALLELAKSNFYSEIHELYLDRGCFGTAVIYVQEGKRNHLTFQTWSTGSYVLAEDEEGFIDTCFRDLELTATHAATMFGAENLSEKMQKILKVADPATIDAKHKFVHAIYPRQLDKIDPRKADGLNMPIASVYIEHDGKHVARESGYREMPFMGTRYLKWGKGVYGWSPSWAALPEARQLNFLEKQLDALAEIAAFPRILMPDGFEGNFDLRAGGLTYFNAGSPNSIPREWATGGRYDIGLDRANKKEKAIEDAFHVDLFQMFAQLDKQMTAREVAERSSEKLIQFSPTFARMTTELFNPLLTRIFALLLRAGAFPPPPKEAFIQDASGAYLPEPKVSYSSRIALAIKSLENASFMRTMDAIAPISQFRPDILDNYDFDAIVRAIGRNDGMPEDWMLPQEEVDESRAARAQAQAEQAKAAEAQQMIETAAKAGNIKPDSMVGQMVANQM